MSGLYNRSIHDIARQEGRRGSPRNVPYARPPLTSRSSTADEEKWQHDMFEGEGARGALSATPSAKLLVQGLHYEVSEAELKDLFERIGPTIKCFIRYDRSGRSAGSATVIYKDVRHSQRARQEYDGANAKGQPIHITFEPLREPKAAAQGKGGDLLSRLGGGDLGDRIGGVKRQAPSNAPRGPAALERPGPQRGASAGRGGGGRGGKCRAPPPTATSLDAELDAFMNTPSNTTAASEHAPRTAEDDTDMQ